MVKPFSMEELLLRVAALIQRSDGGVPGVQGLAQVVRFVKSEVNFTRFFARCAGREVGLSPRELELMEYFLRHEGQTLETRLELAQLGQRIAEGTAALAPTRESATVEVLALLKSDDMAIRIEAIRGLGTLGAVEALPRIIPLVSSGSEAERTAARETLALLHRLADPK